MPRIPHSQNQNTHRLDPPQPRPSNTRPRSTARDLDHNLVQPHEKGKSSQRNHPPKKNIDAAPVILIRHRTVRSRSCQPISRDNNATKSAQYRLFFNLVKQLCHKITRRNLLRVSLFSQSGYRLCRMTNFAVKSGFHPRKIQTHPKMMPRWTFFCRQCPMEQSVINLVMVPLNADSDPRSLGRGTQGNTEYMDRRTKPGGTRFEPADRQHAAYADGYETALRSGPADADIAYPLVLSVVPKGAALYTCAPDQEREHNARKNN